MEKAAHDGSNQQARADMLLGSMLAGQAFANSPVAAVHALAYPIGGHFKIPHGLSNALVLAHVLRFNAVVAPAPYAEMAPSVFPALADMGPQEACRFRRGNGRPCRAADLRRGCAMLAFQLMRWICWHGMR